MGAWTIANFGHKLKLLDIPNQRSSHNYIIPKGGGIGIPLCFAFISFSFNAPFSFWIPPLCAAGIGLLGDRHELSPKMRLILYVAAAVVFTTGLKIRTPDALFGDILFFIFVTVYIAGTANFYNFMDGINGIAAVTGIIGFAFLGFSAGLILNRPFYAIICFCIFFACTGFLPFNMPINRQARVFMGDVGSIFLGFTFACITLLCAKTIVDLICFSCFIFPFYADELTTMAVRIKRRENLTHAHRSHLYQILANEYRLDHWKVTLIYGILQILLGLSFVYLREKGLGTVCAATIFYFILFAAFSYYLRKKSPKNRKYL